MATYSKDKGLKVKSYTEDPSNLSPSAWEGKLYYNSSDGQFKFQTLSAGAWSSGGSLNTARTSGAGAGTQTANIVTSPAGVVTTESYNGTTWTALSSPSNSGEGRAELGGTGTSTSALIFGGWDPGSVADTESWNGSTWTEVNEMNEGRREMGATGPGTAAIAISGNEHPGRVDSVETWDGTSWSETHEVNTQREQGRAGGTQTDCIFACGRDGAPFYNQVETYNGSSWTETTEVNTARSYAGAASNSVLLAGGYGPGTTYQAITESWNGSAWTEVANLATGRGTTTGAPAGSNTSGLVAGGSTAPGAHTATEEWSFSHVVKKVTTG